LCYTSLPSQLPQLEESNYNWQRIHITKYIVMHSPPPPPPPVTSSLFGPNILLSSLDWIVASVTRSNLLLSSS
jgi:hypothetical protein